MSDDLGTCCACGCASTEENPVRTIVFLDFKMPSDCKYGGWGCVVCGLAAEGASAVICDACAAKMKHPETQLRWIMAGENAKHDRRALDSFAKIPHAHDMSRHSEEDYG